MLKLEMEFGFYGYYNFVMGVVNLVVVVVVGVNWIDVVVVGFGVGVGNMLMEVFVVVCDWMGIEMGVDVFVIFDVVEDFVVLIMDVLICFDCDVLMFGYVGVYLLFLLFVKCVEVKYGILVCDIFVELGC